MKIYRNMNASTPTYFLKVYRKDNYSYGYTFKVTSEGLKCSESFYSSCDIADRLQFPVVGTLDLKHPKNILKLYKGLRND